MSKFDERHVLTALKTASLFKGRSCIFAYSSKELEQKVLSGEKPLLLDDVVPGANSGHFRSYDIENNEYQNWWCCYVLELNEQDMRWLNRDPFNEVKDKSNHAIEYKHSTRYGHDSDMGVVGEVHSLVISNFETSMTIDFYSASYGKSVPGGNYELAEQALRDIVATMNAKGDVK